LIKHTFSGERVYIAGGELMVQYSKEFLQEYYDVEWLKYYDLIPDESE